MYGAIQNTAETAELSRTLKEFGHSFHRNSFSGSSSIESLARAVMTAYPSVKLQHGKSGFTVFGEGEFGFPISVEDLGTTRLLYLGPGITEFDSDENVLDHLLQASSSSCRLIVERTGTTVRQWKLVQRCGGGVDRTLLSGGSTPSFWFGKRTTKTYWNDRTAAGTAAAHGAKPG